METIVREKQITLIDRIRTFMEGTTGGVATLKDIYNHISNEFSQEEIKAPNFLKEKIRCVIYRNNNFKRVTKGAYLYTGANSAGLIIHGDGRKLDEIEDESIDTIITDHPWEDKKAHRSGNQKNFSADYESACFRYNQEDFTQKARVLKDGGYLIEFIPTESSSNYEYLYELKQMAKKSGFEYYAKLMWMKTPEGKINTGRTTKGTEDIMVFSKGKPRRLAGPKKPYFTKSILPGRVDIPAPKPKDKRHQAEKVVALYELLIEATTVEGDVTLDQFGGSLNIIEAAVNKNRFAIAYEYISKILQKSVNRLKAVPLFISKEDSESIEEFSEENSVDYEDLLGHIPENSLVVVDIANTEEVSCENSCEEPDKESLEEVCTEVSEDIKADAVKLDTKAEGVAVQLSLLEDIEETTSFKVIPKDVSIFQRDKLIALSKLTKDVFKEDEVEFINASNIESLKDSDKINILFNSVYSYIYENKYKRVNTELSEEQLLIFNDVKEKLQTIFESKIKNEYIRNYYKNYLIESEDFAKYMIKKCSATSFEDIQSNALDSIDEYLDLIGSHSLFKGKNKVTVKTMILKTIL